mmetsp:Transcript_28195/g.34834  ORF Transcript_28195/g.34834 Transcript_28195/m.34834 type:complete len:136 (-) Transcript_28195:2194-2601(-)
MATFVEVIGSASFQQIIHLFENRHQKLNLYTRHVSVSIKIDLVKTMLRKLLISITTTCKWNSVAPEHIWPETDRSLAFNYSVTSAYFNIDSPNFKNISPTPFFMAFFMLLATIGSPFGNSASTEQIILHPSGPWL